jgi:hypothetical protein
MATGSPRGDNTKMESTPPLNAGHAARGLRTVGAALVGAAALYLVILLLSQSTGRDVFQWPFASNDVDVVRVSPVSNVTVQPPPLTGSSGRAQTTVTHARGAKRVAPAGASRTTAKKKTVVPTATFDRKATPAPGAAPPTPSPAPPAAPEPTPEPAATQPPTVPPITTPPLPEPPVQLPPVSALTVSPPPTPQLPSLP